MAAGQRVGIDRLNRFGHAALAISHSRSEFSHSFAPLSLLRRRRLLRQLFRLGLLLALPPNRLQLLRRNFILPRRMRHLILEFLEQLGPLFTNRRRTALEWREACQVRSIGIGLARGVDRLFEQEASRCHPAYEMLALAVQDGLLTFCHGDRRIIESRVRQTESLEGVRKFPDIRQHRRIRT